MKIFTKLLILLTLFFAVLFGSAAYYFNQGLQAITASVAKEIVESVANRVRLETELQIKKMELSDRQHFQEFEKDFRRRFSDLPTVDDFFLLKKDTTVLWALNKWQPNIPVLPKPATDHRVTISQHGDSEFYLALWRYSGSENLLGLLILNPINSVSDQLHWMTLKLYLTGFGGVVAMILLALVVSGIVRSPISQIEKAMTHIDKRRYGFRIKSKKTDEFDGVYQKVNHALTRLEQLDSVQRTATRTRNELLEEQKMFRHLLDILAHEVKNPLHALVINLDVLKTKLQRVKPKPDSLKHVAILELEIDHLREVIDGFLRYMNPGTPQKERLHVDSVIADVCQMVRAQAQKNNIKIETSFGRGQKQILVDKAQLQQALHNIVINAIHASGSGSKITIRSSIKRKRVTISVIDQGAGISKEEIDRIFNLYFTTKKKGSGIGLPITKRIVEANGGQLELESKIEKGTTVTLSFKAV